MPNPEYLRSGVPGPSPQETRDARQRLRNKIAREEPRVWRPGHGWRAAAAIAGMALVAVVGWIVLGSIPRAEAGLDRIASAIEEIPATELPSGAYHYVRIEQSALALFPADAIPDADLAEPGFGIFVDEVREVWLAEDGTIVERVTRSNPVLLDPGLADVIASSDILESLGVGVTATAAYSADPDRVPPESLPTDPQELETWMSRELTQYEPVVSPARLLDLAVQLLTDPAAPPELRAAILRVLATTDGLEVVDLETGDVQVTATSPGDGRPFERTVYIDNSGRVTRSVGVDLVGNADILLPPGAAVDSSRYEYAAPVFDVPASGDSE